MNERTLRIVLAIVGGLVVIYLVSTLGVGGTAEDDHHQLTAELDGVRSGQLESVRILAPDATYDIVPGDDGWTVNGFPADTGAVARLKKALTEARVGSLVSANPANHRRMGVTAGDAWVLEVKRGGNQLRLLIGTEGPHYPSSHVRLPDTDQVLLVRGDLGHVTRRSITEWRDRIILSLNPREIHQLSITRDGDTYRLLRQDNTWMLDGSPVNSEVMAGILEQLARLRALSFPPDDVTMGDPTRSVVAKDGHGETLAELYMAPTAGQDYHARGTQTPYLYDLFGWRVEQVAPERNRLLGRKPS